MNQTSAEKINRIENEWKNFVSGDNDALEVIFETHYEILLYTAFYYLKDEEQSKDIVSDVFLKLLSFSIQQRNSYLAEVNEKLEIFLKVLVKNKCLDQIKVEKNRRNILSGIFSLSNRYRNTDPLIEKDFQFMIETLPERQKQILELHLQGFDNKEISNRLEISYNTVRNTLHTAKSKIRHLHKMLM